jgi:hypothetical protein
MLLWRLNNLVSTVFTGFVHPLNSAGFFSRRRDQVIVFSPCSGEKMIILTHALGSQSQKSKFRLRLAETEFAALPAKVSGIDAITLPA